MVIFVYQYNLQEKKILRGRVVYLQFSNYLSVYQCKTETLTRQLWQICQHVYVFCKYILHFR